MYVCGTRFISGKLCWNIEKVRKKWLEFKVNKSFLFQNYLYPDPHPDPLSLFAAVALCELPQAPELLGWDWLICPELAAAGPPDDCMLELVLFSFLFRIAWAKDVGWSLLIFLFAQALPCVVLLFWELFFDRVAELCSSATSEGFCPQAFSFMSWVSQKSGIWTFPTEFQVRSARLRSVCVCVFLCH